MTNHIAMPPLERLNELLEVVEIPEDKFGKWSGLVWRVKRNGTKGIGSVAGWLMSPQGNPDRVDWLVKVDNVQYVASRVIYFMVYGKDPGNAEVDHEDQNSLNNNPENLRLDTNRDIQPVNRGVFRNNTSGVMGVSRPKKRRKWRVDVKGEYLGEFACKIEAVHTVNKKWRELGWLELGRKLNDLDAIHCDCDKCKSQVDKITE